MSQKLNASVVEQSDNYCKILTKTIKMRWKKKKKIVNQICKFLFSFFSLSFKLLGVLYIQHILGLCISQLFIRDSLISLSF